MALEGPTVFRPGGVSYLRIPAPDPRELARFYAEVFAWSLREHGESPGFTDASGHVIGHFVADQAVTGPDGMRPYIYVESVDRTLDEVAARGGAVVTAPYPEGDLRVATFADPAGNVVGVWQRTPTG